MSSISIKTIAISGRCASRREAIASRIGRQLHPCATPQRPPQYGFISKGLNEIASERYIGVNISLNPIVVDGANIAWNYGKSIFPHVDGISLASKSLLQDGYTVVIVLNARYHDLWPDEIHHLSSLEDVFVVGPISDSKSDDRIMIDYATNKGCKILSNDKFRDHVNSLPQSKRSNAKIWINSEVLQFHFGVNGFTIGPEQKCSRNPPIIKSELAKWMASRIYAGETYNLTDIGMLFVEYYAKSGSNLPTRTEFCQALQLGKNASIVRIIKSLLSPEILVFGQYDGKINLSLTFQKRNKLSLNLGVVDECARLLKGILHSTWVDGLTLSHQLNVGLGNTLRTRVNSDTIKRHLGLPKTTLFRDILTICLGDEIVEFEMKIKGQLLQVYGLKNSQLNKLPVEIKLKSLITEVRNQNYSVLNVTISTLVPEYDEIIGMEDLWRVGIRQSEMAKLLLDTFGKSVKQLFGSTNDMLCVINHWHHGWEHWYFDSNRRLTETISSNSRLD